MVKSDRKKRARINAMRHALNSLDYPNKNAQVSMAPDRLIVGSAKIIYESGEHCLESGPQDIAKKEQHASNRTCPAMTDRFRELVEDAGDSLPDNHYDELGLIIEAGLDTALVETMKDIAGILTDMAHKIKHDAEFFD